MIFRRENGKKGRSSKTEWTAFFKGDGWDDFGFTTTFSVRMVSPAGEQHQLGSVKIGKKGLSTGRISSHPLPNEFEELTNTFFSIGQDINYYATLKSLGDDVREEYLAKMRDIAFQPNLIERFASEPSMNESLFRSVHRNLAKTQFHRVALGKNLREAFEFAYTKKTKQPIEMNFPVIPESQPPTNVHVLIGSNGVGKTTLLKRFADLVRFPTLSLPGESFEISSSEDDTEEFWNLVVVAFSAFDTFGEEPAEFDSKSASDVKYFYFGLKTEGEEVAEEDEDDGEDGQRYVHKSTDDLVEDFEKNLGLIVRSRKGKTERFADAIKILSSDLLIGSSLFPEEFDGDEFLSNPNVQALVEVFREMSSGHKIVLLSLAGLVNRVAEKTLVLIDEPETHLHPPLLSAYIRAVSKLLIELNGVAVVATHSPVVLQEVPQSCVWKLNRQGDSFRIDRPTVETFGENVGTLTREAFGLEVTRSGFFQMLSELCEKHDSYEEVLEALGGQLGAEGRAMVRIMLAERVSQ
ncbi:hypothetical protein SV7mr_31110 [Stieleria bergensis]|uniref:AAA+ ATPase domain-containing protein n=1 Tax=Stieleria bergensis TaxID=2528025 RepID=A0A517SWS6_9BACT|nr:hypothetical protein SV7mr_31110 [Planctomycetes bacterium SV_7m_r]